VVFRVKERREEGKSRVETLFRIKVPQNVDTIVVSEYKSIGNSSFSAAFIRRGEE
jgi:hypothetical protein